MTYLFSSVFSFIGSWRLHNVFLWTMVVMALFNSTIETTQGWSVYHYYVGAKYFKEVGYFELYECTITEPTVRRDLYTYGYRWDEPHCQASFTPERYQEFQRDIEASGYYPGVMKDKGANMTPPWIVFAELLINTGIATPQNVGVFDVIALTIAVGFLLWSIGWRKTGYVLLFMLTFYGTQDRTWGHFGQWVWLAAALVGVAMLEKDRHWGGFWLGVATSLMIFPFVLMLRYWRNQRALQYFVSGLMLILIMGLFNSRGLEGYQQFVQNMQLHSDYIQTELCCNIGLKHTITWTANPTLEYRDCFGSHSYATCKASYHYELPIGYWLVLLPFVLTSPFGLMYGLLTLSRYYYIILCIVPVWYGEKWGRRLLLVNAIIIAWMIADNLSGFILNHWLWFIFFTVLGAKNVLQVIQTLIAHQKQRPHSQATQRDVSQQI